MKKLVPTLMVAGVASLLLSLLLAGLLGGFIVYQWVLPCEATAALLMNIGRPQRFGTQYRVEPVTAPFRLYKVDANVTDELRRQMSAPTLAEAKQRETELNKK